MSRTYRQTIDDDLHSRLWEQYGGDDMNLQAVTRTALHLLVYGSPVEAELRAEIERMEREIERLHETIRVFARATPVTPVVVTQPKPLLSFD